MFVFFQAEDGIRDGHVTGVQTCLFRSLLALFLGPHGGLKQHLYRGRRARLVGVGLAGGLALWSGAPVGSAGSAWAKSGAAQDRKSVVEGKSEGHGVHSVVNRKAGKP